MSHTNTQHLFLILHSGFTSCEFKSSYGMLRIELTCAWQTTSQHYYHSGFLTQWSFSIISDISRGLRTLVNKCQSISDIIISFYCFLIFGFGAISNYVQGLLLHLLSGITLSMDSKRCQEANTFGLNSVSIPWACHLSFASYDVCS